MSELNLVGFDVETRGVDHGYGLQPFRAKSGAAWVTMAAFVGSDDHSAAHMMKPTVEWLRGRLCAARDTGTTIVGWNTAFDVAWLIALGLRKEVFENKWLDGMLLWKHVSNSPEWTGLAPASYGLKAAVAQFMPQFAGYETDIDFNTDDPAELEQLKTYNIKDSLYTVMLANHLWNCMGERMRVSALIEAACIPMVAEAYVEGIRANRAKATELETILTDKANVALVTLKLRSNENIDPTVLASPTKLRTLLYEHWNIPIEKLTDKGAPSTDRDALSMAAQHDDRAKLLNEYRENKNNCTKFATGALNSLEYNGDGNVRPNPRIFSTYTGRMSYSSKILRGKDERPTGVPLHQWKRDKAFRDLMEVPEGYMLCEHDWAGQEFRWMAVMSGDQNMINLCRPGEDAHSFMGSQIVGIAYRDMIALVREGDKAAKAGRQLGKVGNLSCQYRTSADTLRRVARVSYQLDLSGEEARTIHAAYGTSYPGVKKYWREITKQGGRDGYVETIAGRRIHVGFRGDWPEDQKWGRESTCINSPIQGSGADQKYLGLAVLRPYLEKIGGRFYFELHDGLFSLLPKATAERNVLEMRDMLSELPYSKAWKVNLPVAFPVDAKLGPTWGQLEGRE